MFMPLVPPLEVRGCRFCAQYPGLISRQLDNGSDRYVVDNGHDTSSSVVEN